LKTQQVIRAIENIVTHTEEVSASMQELAASSQEINNQMELISCCIDETHQAVKHQVDLARVTKETAAQF
jgi:methyl-accepting chemotaxis protein